MGNSGSKIAGWISIIIGILVIIFSAIAYNESLPAKTTATGTSSHVWIWVMVGIGILLIVLGVALLWWDPFDSQTQLTTNMPYGINHTQSVTKDVNLDGTTTIVHTITQHPDKYGLVTDPISKTGVNVSNLPTNMHKTIPVTVVTHATLQNQVVHTTPQNPNVVLTSI